MFGTHRSLHVQADLFAMDVFGEERSTKVGPWTYLHSQTINIVLPPTGPPHRPDSWGTLLAPPHPLESLVAQALLGGSKTLYDPASKGLRHGGNPLRCRKKTRCESVMLSVCLVFGCQDYSLQEWLC